jgi:exodeoxyribonuclease V alpha subunit
VALLGDRHQLAAVGRGGVLDLAIGRVDPAAHLTLGTVHRFTRAGVTAPDTEYADVTLAMRTGDDPGAVFDALCARGQIRIHPDAATLQEALATTVAAHHGQAEQVAVVVDTREQAAELGAAIRERLVADGRVDDTGAVITRSGQRIGAGDRIATRRNDRDLGVANRDTWVVTAVGRHGELEVTPAGATGFHVTPAGVTPTGGVPAGVTPALGGQPALSADYVARHVELAYVSTAHGVQGDTVASAHVVIGEHTGAASAYVGMTRGREGNTAHLIATDLANAREQWIAVFARDRADLGPAHAAELAGREAARYARPRPTEQVLAELHQAWTTEQRCLDRLILHEPLHDALQEVVALEAGHADRLAAVEAHYRNTAVVAERTRERADAIGEVVASEADRVRDTLLRRWDSERDAAHAAARVVLDGPGRLGLRRAVVAHAGEQLTGWANRWRRHLPDLPSDTRQIAQIAGWFDDRPAIWTAFDDSAGRAAEQGHPELAASRASADAARHEHDEAWHALKEVRRQHENRMARFGAVAFTPDPAARLADTDRDMTATHKELAAAQARIAQFRAEPAVLSQPPERLAQERDVWRARRDAERTQPESATPRPTDPTPGVTRPQPEPLELSAGRSGSPSLGR